MTVDTQARDRELANMLQVARGEASRAKVELEHLRSILPSEEVEAKSDVDARIAMVEQDCQDQLAAFKQKLTRANKLNKVLQEALRSGAIKTDAAMKWQRAAARATNT
jgi:predicted alternative tryptophan synthase beta-subunit